MVGLCFILGVIATPAIAVPIVDDPNGFEGIPWGTTFSQSGPFLKIEDDGRQQTYERKGASPALGSTTVDSIRFTAFKGKFGRVTVRYSGMDTHNRLLDYLQNQYGKLDSTPGQIAVGPVKVYTWHGFDTEVTLRFEANVERGIIFFESRAVRDVSVEENSATVF